MEECSDESEVMRRKLNFLVWDLELEMSSLRKQQGSWRVGQGDSGRKSAESRNLAKPSVVREREQRKKKRDKSEQGLVAGRVDLVLGRRSQQEYGLEESVKET